MRKLPIFALALLAGLALTPIATRGHASAPQPSPKPKDPDLESGRQAIEAQNWKVAIEDFNRAAARDPKNADAQNLLGYSYRKSGNLDMASSTTTRRCASTRATRARTSTSARRISW